MSIIKGTNQIVAGFGGTKRPLGEVYFSQSSLATDNPGALPGWTGEYYENGKTLFPDLYNFVKAHSELQVTKTDYDNAIATYGECPKYVVDENASGGTGTAYKIRWAEPSVATSIIKSQTPQVGDIVYESEAFTEEPYDLSTATQYTIEAVSYSSSGSLSSITINSASMRVRTLTSVSVTGLSTVAGTSLRLPKYANYIKMANSAEGIKNIEAGLPNITGYASPRKDGYAGGGLAGGAFWLTSDTESAGHPATENGPGTRINFDASRSSAVYGKSSTVTPASTTLYPWVVAYTAAIPASTAQAAEFQNALSGKADVDLSNITSLGKKSSVSWIMPDYSRGVATGQAGHPTSALTNSYTCPTDGWILMQASKETPGYTLYFYVNGNIKLSFPAFSACYGNTMYPVRKGDVIYLRTDSTSATWVVNWCDFIPCKGA